MNKFCSSLWLVIVLFFVTACSPKSDYTQAIPKGATAVVAVDMQRVTTKSGLSTSEGVTMVSKVTQLLKAGLEGETYRLAQKVLQEPAELGLSFSEKLYLFAAPDGSAQVVLAKVTDRKKLEKVFDLLAKSSLCSPLVNEEGCSFTQIGQLLCLFNDGAFFLLHSPAGHAANFKGTLFSWLRQESGEGFSATPDFKALTESKGEVVAVINMGILPRDLTMKFRMGMPANLKVEDLKFLFDLSFEQGKSVISCKSLTTKLDWQTLFDQIDLFTSPMNGSLLELFPGNTLFTVGANLKGGKAYELLCQNPSIRHYINNPMIDVESIFRAIEGEAIMGYSSLFNDHYLGYAQVTDNSFLRTIEALRPLLALTGGKMQLNTVATNEYEFRSGYQSTWFGVKNGLLYVTNNKTWAEESGRKYGASLRNLPWATQVGENRSFTACNVNELLRQTKGSRYLDHQLGKTGKLVFDLLVEPCDYVSTMTPKATEMVMELRLKEKNRNALQLLLRNLETYIK